LNISVGEDSYVSEIYLTDKEPDGENAPEYYSLSQYVRVGND